MIESGVRGIACFDCIRIAVSDSRSRADTIGRGVLAPRPDRSAAGDITASAIIIPYGHN